MRGWNTLPSKLPGQIALLSLLFFGTMIFWHWEAMLISYLATKTISLPFKDITDLVENTQFKIIIRPGSTVEDAFKTSPDQNWQGAWIDRVQPHLEEHVGLSLQVMVDKMTRDEASAFLTFILESCKHL